MSSLIPGIDERGGWLFWTLIPVLVVYVVQLFQRNLEIRAFKKRENCHEAPRYPHTDIFFGSDLFRERMLAVREGRYFRLYLKHFEKYGKTFQDNMRGHVTLNTMESRNVQHVLALKTEDYRKNSARMKAHTPFIGPSVFSDGPQWKHSRAMIKPLFDRAELSDMDQLASFTHRFMELIPEDGSTVDMQHLLQRLFLDVSTDFVLGEPIGGLQTQMPEETTEFLSALRQAQRWVSKRRDAGWLSLFYDYSSDWVNAYQTVHHFIDKRVKRALESMDPKTTQLSKSEDNDESFGRKRYVLLNELAKQIRDPVALRYQVLAVFLPAHDTVSRAVSNALFQLARHPMEWSKLRQIALNRGQEPLTLEKLKSLVEFRYVILEAIRTLGPLGRVVREAVRDTVLPVGGGIGGKSSCFVRKGTTVSMSTWSMCHDPETWGEDVESFKPDRWIGRKTYWEFVPFSGGPRICPAQQQVITHATYLLIKLTQRFEVIENRDASLEYVEQLAMGPKSKNGVQVAFWASRKGVCVGS